MIHAGTARVDITPPAGSLMACFPRGPNREPRRAEGAHDPLLSRVLVLSDGHETVAICSCDVALFREVDVRRVRALVGRRVPTLDGPRLVLAATHTHSSPETSYLFGNTPDDPWIQDMDSRIADAVCRAHAAMVPAEIHVGRARAELAHNRRVTGGDGKARMVYDYDPAVTTGPSDEEMAVIRVDGETGRTVAVVYNFAAHALTVGPKNLLYTADFPGVASARIEEACPGCTALFLNGAAGDQHPRKSMREGFETAREIGEALGVVVLETLPNVMPVQTADITFASDMLSFANRADASLKVDVEVSRLQLGHVVMGFVPGEPFVEYQMRFKREVSPAVGVFVGYANGWPGYIPTESARAEGGYGVDACAWDPPALSRTSLPPDAGDAILERLLALRADQ